MNQPTIQSVEIELDETDSNTILNNSSIHRFVETMWELLALATSGIISLLIFGRVASRAGIEGFNQDFISHFQLLVPLSEESWWLYSGWYYFQALLLAGSPFDEQALIKSGMLLLVGFAFLKGVALYAFIRAFSFHRLTSILVSAGVGTAMAFPTLGLQLNFYLGTVPPNVFHTATQLLANVTAVFAVLTLCVWATQPERRTWILMSLGAALSALSKPALTLPLLLGLFVVGVILIMRQPQKWKVILFQVTGASAIPLGTLLMNTYVTYASGSERTRQIALAPLEVWQVYSNNIPIDLIRSWAFPLVVLVVLGLSGLLRSWWLFIVPAWAVAGMAVLIHLLMAEINNDGTVNLDGNLGWGAIAASSALYLISAIAVLKCPRKVQVLAWITLIVQVIATFVHQSNWILSGSYL